MRPGRVPNKLGWHDETRNGRRRVYRAQHANMRSGRKPGFRQRGAAPLPEPSNDDSDQDR